MFSLLSHSVKKVSGIQKQEMEDIYDGYINGHD